MSQFIVSSRYTAIDALRGFIMIVMAIDHASAFIARQHSSEFWAGAMSSYTSAAAFLTRWITHLCAPGFFFLMGAGIEWFAVSRRAAGWTESAIARRIAIRGFALFLAGQIFETPLLVIQTLLKPAAVQLSRVTAPPPNDGSALYWGMITLSGLGMVMMVCAALLRFRPAAWIAVSALCVVATNTLLPASGKPAGLWQAILLAPGLSQHVIVVYPVTPWLAGAAAGLWFGHWWRSQRGESTNRVLAAGVILVLIAVALRASGGWGNIRPPRDSSWIEFLNNVKYPPSLVFWTMSLGIDLLVLSLLMRAPEAWKSARSPLIVFGQTPLFFYIVHFYLFAAFGFTLFREAGSLTHLYLMWIVALVLLYPACVWYRGFKSAKPAESIWRMF